MQFSDLRDFLLHKMSMSHVYQPLLIRALIDAGGTATIRQLAQDFLKQDESQLLYYEKRIKEMPAKVLARHGIIEKQNDLLSLTTKRLTLVQKAELRKLCDQKLQDFIVQKGISIWDYRLIDNKGISDILRYRVLLEAKGRCALCGASSKEVQLHIDHIVPRSKKGKTVYENLQALCAKCNCTKGNNDATDFRGYGQAAKPSGIPFFEKKWILENDRAFAVLDGFPVSQGHTLICPKRRISELFDASQVEIDSIWQLARIRQKQLVDGDRLITGFNLGVNSGVAAGQTVPHLHFHLIPRRKGDTPSPSGGVRGVIPGRMHYR